MDTKRNIPKFIGKISTQDEGNMFGENEISPKLKDFPMTAVTPSSARNNYYWSSGTCKGGRNAKLLRAAAEQPLRNSDDPTRPEDIPLDG